ncbi:MAG: sigma-54-dependent Fis family transcriptional regulator [Bacteroidales bacterium]|nr:sigma-54-dependent Fis family transcriptional regulator [Bacteroidales bacterium]
MEDIKKSTFTILVVDDNPKNVQLMGSILRDIGYEIEFALDGEKALAWLTKKKFDLILLDIMMPGISGFEVCKKIRENPGFNDLPVIFLSAKTDKESILEGFELGAQDYVSKPFDTKELLARVETHLEIRYNRERLKNVNKILEQKVLERTTQLEKSNADLTKALKKVKLLKDQLEEENISLLEELKLEHKFDYIIGGSPSMKKTLLMVEEVAPTETTVLIEGETGVGKELIARAIHNSSRRNKKPLIKVNCAALPSSLIESELFGYEKGAFTGAEKSQMGRFELADKGTIFLDEIGELPLELQVKILRVIQDGEFERLGSPVTRTVDVRIITATNRILKKEIKEGRFREDLYFRLNVYPIRVGPLREKKDDIPLLVNYFVKKLSKRVGKEIEKIPQRTMNILMNYSWPGNIRELENVIERAMITSKGKTLRLPDKLPEPESVNENLSRLSLHEMERNYIVEILEETYWKVNGNDGAARILDMHPETLRSKMKKLNINKPSRKV